MTSACFSPIIDRIEAFISIVMTNLIKKEPKVGVGFGVMILKGGKVLLGKRHSDPKKADSALHGEGTWTMPGGKLDFGEELRDGAYREVLEETGMKINRAKLELISVADNIVTDAHFLTIGFLCRDFSHQPEIREPEEITEWRWFPINHLPHPMYFPSAKIIKHYQSKQVY